MLTVRKFNCTCHSLIILNSCGHCTVSLLAIQIQLSLQVCEGSLVLVFECSEEVMVRRLVERGKTSGRVDDNEETIRKRLTTYNEATLPVIHHFQCRNKVKTVTWANCCQICKAFSTCYQKWRVSNVLNASQTEPVLEKVYCF